MIYHQKSIGRMYLTHWKCCLRRSEVENQDGAFQPGTKSDTQADISACGQDRNKITKFQWLNPCFGNPMEVVGIIFDRTRSGKYKMAAKVEVKRPPS